MTLRRALTCTIALAAAVAGATASAAQAGTYDVVACAAAPGSANRSWTASNSAPGALETGDGCGTGTSTYSGLFARDLQSTPTNIQPGQQAGWTFTAPAGLQVSAATLNRYLYAVQDPGIFGEITADAAVLERCNPTSPNFICQNGRNGGGPTETPVTFTGLNAGALRIGLRCQPSGLADSCAPGGHAFNAVLYSARVTVRDDSAPAVQTPSGSLVGGSWMRGTKTLGAAASDASGISELRVRDITNGAGTVLASRPLACDMTLPKPCVDQPTATQLDVPTTTMSDGVHQVVAEAVDAAQNPGDSAPRVVKVDNTAPGRPGLTAQPAAGNAWQSTSSFSVSVTPAAAQASPVVATLWRLCSLDGTSCDTVQRSPTPTGSSTLQVSPGEGQSRLLQVWQEDEAGNVAGPSQTSDIVLRQDTQAPAAPEGVAVEQDPIGGRLLVRWTDPPQTAAPIDSAFIEICATDGCRTEERPDSGPQTFALPAPGPLQVRVWLKDAAGNTNPASSASANTTVTGSPAADPPGSTATSPTTTAQLPPPTDPPADPPPSTPVKTRVSFRFTVVRATRGRLRVSIRAAAGTTGRLQIKVALKDRAGKPVRRARRRAVSIRAGRAEATIPGASRARTAVIALTYAGDARHLPRSQRQSLKLRA